MVGVVASSEWAFPRFDPIARACTCGACGQPDSRTLFNNPGLEGHIITALRLDPRDLHAGFWAGELTVGGVYHVVLDEWHHKLMEANMKALERGLDESQAIPPKLPAINVREIVDKKYAIEGRSQERFQVRLGLRRSIDFLYGTVRVTVKTDRGAEVTSEPLSVVVCTPGSALKSAP